MSNDKIKGGGPAFPTITADVVNMYGAEAVMHYTDPDRPGMSLRDWFAGQAIIALALGRTLILNDPDGPDPDELTIGDEAKDAYRYADAMLAERDKEPTNEH